MARSFENGLSSEQIFESVANERHLLANKIGNQPSTEFGRLRAPEKKKASYSPIGLYASDQNESSPIKIQLLELVDQLYEEPGWGVLLGGGEFVNKSIQLSNGTKVPGGDIGYDGNDYLYIKHPHPTHAKKIFEDVHKKMNKLLAFSNTKSLSELQIKTEFLTIMYEYYSAMPYYRGSSSIGNVVFSELYYKLFGKTLPQLEDGIDMIAMIYSNPQDFINRYLDKLTK